MSPIVFWHVAQPTGKRYHVQLHVHHCLQVFDSVNSPSDFVGAETLPHNLFYVLLESHNYLARNPEFKNVKFCTSFANAPRVDFRP
jgi:hypothetical protein